MTFATRVAVRAYELDTQGHLNQAVYMQYAEHARWECLRAAGLPGDKLLATGVGPVTLETNLKFRRELRGGDEVDVTCRFVFGDGKTFRIEQEIRRTDGTVAAEITSVCGLLDLTERRLLHSPGDHFASLAERPETLGG
ncbi:acyl-CoA thioesterase [Actinomadura rudentiformis]|uniref:Acyl-CoA thioesterase n=1 Tax=Actinomadura rudentiformis TaxID=359158 RepID=A0A6H9Z4P4_9ACTN|nr:acyl-CoA thioesterase [Actinomadura rudentiformis]KAB2349629.1 acyl-CoA thioesterase [Actinomadura rudentiformis]